MVFWDFGGFWGEFRVAPGGWGFPLFWGVLGLGVFLGILLFKLQVWIVLVGLGFGCLGLICCRVLGLCLVGCLLGFVGLVCFDWFGFVAFLFDFCFMFVCFDCGFDDGLLLDFPAGCYVFGFCFSFVYVCFTLRMWFLHGYYFALL